METPNAMMAVALGTFVAVTGGSEVAAETKPNVIFILADDWGYGDVKVLGGARCKIETPNMDRLAGEGMIFTDAHSSSSVCTPSRYSVLTGRYNWRSTLKRTVQWGIAPPLIEPDRKTVAAFMQENGYETACFGKWHVGMNMPMLKGGKRKEVDWKGVIQQGPTDVGFGTFVFNFGKNEPVQPDKHYPSKNLRGHKADIFEGGHRVPFIARWKGQVAPGSACSRTVSLVDLFATCADLVGKPVGEADAPDSVSFAPYLHGKFDTALREATVLHSYQGAFAIRKGKWKLELCPDSGGWSWPRPGKDKVKGFPPIQRWSSASRMWRTSR